MHRVQILIVIANGSNKEFDPHCHCKKLEQGVSMALNSSHPEDSVKPTMYTDRRLILSLLNLNVVGPLRSLTFSKARDWLQ